MTVVEICMIIIAVAEIFRSIVMIVQMRMSEQRYKDYKDTSDKAAAAVEEALKQQEELNLKPEHKPEPIMTGIKIVPTAQTFECWFKAGDMCANPESKAYKGKCITTNPKLCRWSELRVRGEELRMRGEEK